MANQSPHQTVEYEVWMMRATQEQIAAWDKTKLKRRNRVAYCAMVESFLVHARNLFEFFYDERDPKFPGGLRPDDVLPSGTDWPRPKRMPRRMRTLRDRINVTLHHIKTTRPATPHNWSLREIRDHIDSLVGALNRLEPVRGRIKGDRHPGLPRKGT